MKLAALMLALASLLSADTWYLTLAGLGGEPDYETRFAGWAKDLERAIRAAVPEAEVVTLAGKDATREGVRKSLAEISRKAKPDDLLVVVLIGHGTWDGEDYKFNVPGADLTAAELASLLDGVPAARQAVFNCTSASGGSVAALRKQDRVVVTAARSGMEKNATVFARYLVEAFRDPAADTDKNEVLSALEAFRYADQKTVKFYETQKRLATEHALLEDTGQGEGVRSPSPQNGQGLAAGRFPLLRIGAAQAAARDPEKKKLLSRKEELEGKIDKLKYEKAAMPIEAYRKQLAALLLELAKTQEALETP